MTWRKSEKGISYTFASIRAYRLYLLYFRLTLNLRRNDGVVGVSPKSVAVNNKNLVTNQQTGYYPDNWDGLKRAEFDRVVRQQGLRRVLANSNLHLMSAPRHPGLLSR
jgi:hypothetical protein